MLTLEKNKKRNFKNLTLSISLIFLFNCNNRKELITKNDLILYINHSYDHISYQNYFIKAINTSNSKITLFNSLSKVKCQNGVNLEVIKHGNKFDTLYIEPNTYEIITLRSDNDSCRFSPINCNISINYLKESDLIIKSINKLYISTCFKVIPGYLTLESKLKVCDDTINGFKIKDFIYKTKNK
jgi:hypothetical protein